MKALQRKRNDESENASEITKFKKGFFQKNVRTLLAKLAFGEKVFYLCAKTYMARNISKDIL